MLRSTLFATLLIIHDSNSYKPDSMPMHQNYKEYNNYHQNNANSKQEIHCPFMTAILEGTAPSKIQGTPYLSHASIPSLDEYNKALYNLDIEAVITDIEDLLTDSNECWPADSYYGNDYDASYGPLFIRLAWHCSGTFRDTDGLGGCTGGRQRFEPEASWEDNTNLDKARSLLAPIKEKYGIALSWGDLMTMAGSTAIMNMGGPIDEICVGRIDDEDGTKSIPLDPSQKAPCPVPGNCSAPLGADTPGLIYVNPEGFMGLPDPLRSAQQIRDVFGRMGMNDTETVALIGGGHAFGKSHGACPDGAGLPPNEAPFDSYSGNCGTGRGADTFTSGLEGQWTFDPLKWDNEFFQLLADDFDAYELIKGPGGHFQWKHRDNGLMMFTTDLALYRDERYREIVKEFAEDIDALDDAFGAAWYKLTTRGGQWAEAKRCIHF